ncbi:hypothetical protein C1646_754616 [Rhizophagus diaphanus]|nr:hypothetical protein C1646_754616 [Rhizophagus diaphanus] [Rhizophagus sp. MUCL 43196]
MGYQTRFSVQQAGHHGVTQSRRRLFLLVFRNKDRRIVLSTSIELTFLRDARTCFYQALFRRVEEDTKFETQFEKISKMSSIELFVVLCIEKCVSSLIMEQVHSL